MFEFMDVVTLQAVFVAEGEGNLPEYLGSTVRGVLGHCFRDFVCHTPHLKCLDCKKKEHCAFVKNFSNTGAKGGAINPFVLYVHTYGKTEWKKGDECVFDLTLFGHAALKPQIYVDALQRMGRKGWGAARIPFSLQRICDYETKKLIQLENHLYLRNLNAHFMILPKREVKSVLVVFNTPVRIVSGGRLFTSLPFALLLRFILRRFALVTEVCTDYEVEWNEEEALRDAGAIQAVEQKWKTVDFKRYSMNQKDNMLELQGQEGWVLYEGDLSRFVPLLEAGRYLHVGKNSTIGFGHYELYFDGEEENG